MSPAGGPVAAAAHAGTLAGMAGHGRAHLRVVTCVLMPCPAAHPSQRSIARGQLCSAAPWGPPHSHLGAPPPGVCAAAGFGYSEEWVGEFMRQTGTTSQVQVGAAQGRLCPRAPFPAAARVVLHACSDLCLPAWCRAPCACPAVALACVVLPGLGSAVPDSPECWLAHSLASPSALARPEAAPRKSVSSWSPAAKCQPGGLGVGSAACPPPTPRSQTPVKPWSNPSQTCALVALQICTKFAPLPWRQTPGSLVGACRKSLQRLGVPKVALYIQHVRGRRWRRPYHASSGRWLRHTCLQCSRRPGGALEAAFAGATGCALLRMRRRGAVPALCLPPFSPSSCLPALSCAACVLELLPGGSHADSCAWQACRACGMHSVTDGLSASCPFHARTRRGVCPSALQWPGECLDRFYCSPAAGMRVAWQSRHLPTCRRSLSIAVSDSIRLSSSRLLPQRLLQ